MEFVNDDSKYMLIVSSDNQPRYFSHKNKNMSPDSRRKQNATLKKQRLGISVRREWSAIPRT